MARRVAAQSAVLPTLDADMRIIVLFGPDEMRKREALDQLRAVLKARHGDCDTIFFPGASATLAQVLDEVRTYSLLQPFKIVLVDEADDFVKRAGHREALERYAQSPVDQAVLVLRSTQWNKGNLDKLIGKVGQVVRCDPLPRQQVPAWLIRRCRDVWSCTLESAAANLLADRLGADLMRLDSELAKLAAAAGAAQGTTISAAAVGELVGQSSDEKAWAIQSAILDRLQHRDGDGPPGGGMIEKIHELVDLAGNDEVPVQFAVTDLMRKLAYAAILRKGGANDYKIGQTLGLWGPARETVLALSARVPPGQARRWFDRAMELDLRSRSGLGQSLRNLECFCATLADESQVQLSG